MDVPSLIHHKQETRQLRAVYCEGSVCETVEANQLSNEELLELNVDVLIPAAIENQITAQNAARVVAPVIGILRQQSARHKGSGKQDGRGRQIGSDLHLRASVGC